MALPPLEHAIAEILCNAEKFQEAIVAAKRGGTFPDMLDLKKPGQLTPIQFKYFANMMAIIKRACEGNEAAHTALKFYLDEAKKHNEMIFNKE